MNENYEKILELLKDDAFADAVLSAESSDAVQQLFGENGVDLSIAEIKALGKSLTQSEGELSEEDLENVAGGNIVIPEDVRQKILDTLGVKTTSPENEYHSYHPAEILRNMEGKW